MIKLAEIISGKLNLSQGPTKLVIPMRGFSEADAEGAPLYDQDADQLFVMEIKARLDSKVDVIEVQAHINDEQFAETVVNTLDAMVR
jgi:uncharacterized protein (UPF0261 family)